MKYYKLTLTVFFMLLLTDFSSAQSNTSPPRAEIQPVSYCELIRNAVGYDKKMIRVRAIYVVGFEAAYLYDPACSRELSGDNRAWIEFSDAYEKSSDPKIRKKFLKLLKSSKTNEYDLSRVEVVFVGKFDGVRQNAEIKAKGGKVFKFSVGYGHMNGYDYQITVESIEEAKPVPKGALW